MMAMTLASTIGFNAPAAIAPRADVRSPLVSMETKADLVKLANDLNPVVGFWDPLGLVDLDLWGQDQEATIGWWRESEIKHGRVAMAGFIGYLVHQSGFRTTGDQIANSVSSDLNAPEVWDAIPEAAKFQIVTFVGVMELWRENKVVLNNEGQKHYMRGGKPGYFPTFDLVPHPVPFNLYDPFGTIANGKGGAFGAFGDGAPLDPKDPSYEGRLKEINNGRLAMLGIMGFCAEAKIPGSVPLLKGVIAPYDGEFMAPFANSVFEVNPGYTGFLGFSP
jgi:hypothetical protein